MDLTGAQVRILREGLQKGFLGWDGLNMFLVEELNRTLNSYAGHTDTLPVAAFKVITGAEAEGWVGDLLVAAVATRPRQEQIARVASELGLTGMGPNLSNDRPIGGPPAAKPLAELESIIEGHERFADVEKFIQRASALQAQVCRIEVTSPDGNGTGFLVGPDVVLTNYHVMKPVLDGEVLPAKVVCRFDYRRSADGTTVRNGTPFALKDDGKWKIDSSPYSQKDLVDGQGEPAGDELDYCLMRLAEAAGDGKAGGSQDPGADERGWIKTSKARSPGKTGDPIFVMQHPAGRPLKLAIGAHLGVNRAGNRMRYDADTLAGSSGSPVFNADLEAIGLHHRGDPKADVIAMTADHNQGVPIGSIVTMLASRNVEKFWDD